MFPSTLRARFITGDILRPDAMRRMDASEVKTAIRSVAEGIVISIGFIFYSFDFCHTLLLDGTCQCLVFQTGISNLVFQSLCLMFCIGRGRPTLHVRRTEGGMSSAPFQRLFLAFLL